MVWAWLRWSCPFVLMHRRGNPKATCEFCGEQFENQDGCNAHEAVCKSRPLDVSVRMEKLEKDMETLKALVETLAKSWRAEEKAPAYPDNMEDPASQVMTEPPHNTSQASMNAQKLRHVERFLEHYLEISKRGESPRLDFDWRDLYAAYCSWSKTEDMVLRACQLGPNVRKIIFGLGWNVIFERYTYTDHKSRPRNGSIWHVNAGAEHDDKAGTDNAQIAQSVAAPAVEKPNEVSISNRRRRCQTPSPTYRVSRFLDHMFGANSRPVSRLNIQDLYKKYTIWARATGYATLEKPGFTRAIRRAITLRGWNCSIARICKNGCRCSLWCLNELPAMVAAAAEQGMRSWCGGDHIRYAIRQFINDIMANAGTLCMTSAEWHARFKTWVRRNMGATINVTQRALAIRLKRTAASLGYRCTTCGRMINYHTMTYVTITKEGKHGDN